MHYALELKERSFRKARNNILKGVKGESLSGLV